MKKKIILMSIFTALFVFMGVYINEIDSYVYSIIGIVAGWSNLLISKQNLELKTENEVLKSANTILIQQQQKSLDEMNALRQKYSRTNQPRSGGRFVKKSIPFKCPKGDYSCPYVDTMTSTLSGDCNSCKYNPL